MCPMKTKIVPLLFALAGPTRLFADSIAVTITVGNGYGFRFSLKPDFENTTPTLQP